MTRAKSWSAPDAPPWDLAMVARLLAAVVLAWTSAARAQSSLAAGPPASPIPPISIISPAVGATGVGAVLQSDPLADEILAVNALSDDGRLAVVAGVKIGATRGDIVVWDTTHDWIVDRLHLPGAQTSYSQVQFDPGGTSIFLEATLAPDDGACKLLRYHVDLLTAQVGVETIAVAHPRPAASEDLAQVASQAFHPSAQDLADDAICNGKWGTLALPTHANSLGLSLRQAKDRRLSNELQLIDARGKVLTELAVSPQSGFDRATISPDAHRIALLNPNEDWSANQGRTGNDRTTVIRTFDLVTRQFLPSAVLAETYDTILWLDADRYVVLEASDPGMQEDAVPPPARIMDATTGKEAGPAVTARCFMKPLAGGFIGAGLANCTTLAPNTGLGIEIYDPQSGWRNLVVPALARSMISDLAVSPDHRTVALALGPRDLENATGSAAPPGGGVMVIDLADGKVLAYALENEVLGYARVSYAAEGRILVERAEQGNGARWLWDFADAKPQPVPDDGLDQDRTVNFDPSIVVGNAVLRTHNGGGFSGQVTRVDLAAGKQQRSINFDGAATSDLAADHQILAVETDHNGIQFWNTQRWSLIMTLHFFAKDRYFVVAPDGRYDTNLGADTSSLRWLASDQRLRSLAPQAFMRQYFEPDLAARLLDCHADHTCAATFKPVADILSLNRVLPKVRDLEVHQGPMRDTARVDIAVEPGYDPAAPNGKTRSGLYNLRLFRNDALVGHWPERTGDKSPPDGRDIIAWRNDSRLPVGPDGAFHITRIVRLPTDRTAPSEPGKARIIEFSAYAFNEDRVKGDTVRVERPFVLSRSERRPRAYVLAIGINRYDAAQLQLKYAAPDALLIAQRLGVLPGYDVRPLPLVGSDMRVTKALIGAALTLLATPPFGSEQAYSARRATALATLHAAGIDGTAFEPATPDDLVIISYSGHGWTDPAGNFFMLPADAKWLPTGPPADHASLIGAEELADWLEAIDAGDMALVIDACHSAASVAAGGFKPGPMGDAGLGQLAYDKGIRIIAASQTQDVAFEDERLQHGLLTYALAQEGLDDQGFGAADLDNDRRIMLDEWLRFAVAELPPLSTKVRRRHIAEGFGGPRRVTVIRDSLAEPQPQIPALFDFHSAASSVVMRIGDRP
jgi:hypothetical protein